MAYKSKYTGLQIDDILDSVGSKQTQIEDLESIRAGAQKGATALQSYTEQYKGTVTGVKINGTTKNPSSGVVDLGTVITEHQTLKTINGESIVGSGDITISGGSSSGGSGAYSEVNHGTEDITFTLTPNTFHVWDEVASLTLDFGSETSGVANEFLFQFTSGATATSLTLPDDIKWANDSAPTIEPNMIYQVSVLKGLASVLEFSKGRVDNPIFVSETDAIGYEFTYPTASELIIVYQGPYGTTPDLTLPVGTTSFQCPSGKSGTIRGNILSITPQNDAVYNYILP